VNKPRTTGIVQWMLNSAWPSMYWQLYDWYGVPTSSYWAVRRGANPWQLVYNYKDNGVYLVNELAEGASGLTARVECYDAASRLVSRHEVAVDAEADCSLKICEVERLADGVTFVSLSLHDAEGRKLADNFYALTSRHDRHDYAASNWYTTPIAEYADFRAMADMPAAELKITPLPRPEGDAGRLAVEVRNTSKTIALYTTLKLKNAAGEVVAPVFWSDNYFSLTPGESRTITIDASGVDSNELTLTAVGWNVPEQRHRPIRITENRGRE